MLDMDDSWGKLIRGAHTTAVTAQGWYGQESTGPLTVIEGSASYQADYDGDALVRSSMTLAIDDEQGRLLPYSPTSPLAPFGQTIEVTQRVGTTSVGAGRSEVELPLGTYLLDDPKPEGDWALHRKRTRAGKVVEQMVRMGGWVSLQCPDLLTKIAESGLGMVQPLAGATVASEVQRLARGYIAVDVSSIPAKSIQRGSMVYDTDRLAALAGLARLVRRVLRANRYGELEMVEAKIGVPVWSITIDDGSWIDTALTPSRDGLINTFVLRGEDNTTAGTPLVMATAVDNSGGPYSANSPLGPRVKVETSPLIRTNAEARTVAPQMLAGEIAQRQVRFTARAIFNPAVEVLDTHRVVISPKAGRAAGSRTLDALCVGLKVNCAGGEMELTYQAPQSALDRAVGNG